MIKELFYLSTCTYWLLVKMCLGSDGSVLVSCSEDSNICVWEVKNTANKTRKIDKPLVYTDDILVNLSKYDKLHENIKKIETAVNKLETENAINVNATIKANEQEIKDINKANTTQYYETIKKNEVITFVLKMNNINI